MTRLKLGLAVVTVAALCFTLGLPAFGSGASARRVETAGATFDLYSRFPSQMVSPSTGTMATIMPLDVRNIVDRRERVTLKAEPDSGYFRAKVRPGTVSPRGKDGKASCVVTVSCRADTPDGAECWIKVTGTRGGEQHHMWLTVKALASSPVIKTSRGVPFSPLGQGYKDPELQAFTGKPLAWHLQVKNLGAAEDIYRLGYRADFRCRVTFKDANGNRSDKVRCPGTSRNLLYSDPVELIAEVMPLEALPKNEPREVTLVAGPGKHSGAVSEVKVRVVNPGMLFCINDLSGLRPHPHQVMPGETTSFVFHVSNLDKAPADVTLSTSSIPPEWSPRLEGARIKRLKPASTADSTLTITAPPGATEGTRLDVSVDATSSTGRKDSAAAAVEVTNTRNIYYLSIDSMNPEYLELDRKGTGKGRDGDWLMPNLHAFMSEGVNYKNASVYLPSATDMNHTNALAGTYTGTSGIYMVAGTFHGIDEHDRIVCGVNNTDLMRYGPDGKPIERAYEVAKINTGGKALCGFWSNKNWLAELEAEKTVDILGTSERWPLFFKPPHKYVNAGDPVSDGNPADRLSVSAKDFLKSKDPRAVVIPTLLGQFDLVFGMKLLALPISRYFGVTPGEHMEDRYIMEQYTRSLVEEDPDVSYINIGDLDNTGHFTGASWDLGEWKSSGRPDVSWDESKYSPLVRRDEMLDIAREADLLFGRFVDLLKQRGVYDNSIIAFLSDHGMENFKDPKDNFEMIDLREILREKGLLHREDYQEFGGTEINLVWCKDPAKLSIIEQALRDYTVDDPELGTVHPLTIVNRREMKEGADYGAHGRIRPGELYSEYWIDNYEGSEGQMWPDLFIFPLYNYQVLTHGDALSSGINNVGIGFGITVPDEVQIGVTAGHGGLQTTSIPLIFKAPKGYVAYRPGGEVTAEVAVGDIAPTIYGIMGWEPPPCVDGKQLPAP